MRSESNRVRAPVVATLAIWMASCGLREQPVRNDVSRAPVGELGLISKTLSGDNPAVPSVIQPLDLTSIGNDVFVLDGADNKLKKLDEEGRCVLSFAGKGRAPEQLDNPLSLRATESHLYVIDSGNRAIKKYDPTGVLTECIPLPSSEGSASLSFTYTNAGTLFVNPIGIDAHPLVNMYTNPRASPLPVGENTPEMDSLLDIKKMYEGLGWLAFDERNQVLTFAYAIKDRILQFDAHGKKIRGIVLGLETPDVNLKKAAGSTQATMLGGALYFDILARDGTVRVLYADGSAGWSQGNQIAVLDSDGKVIRRLPLPKPAGRFCLTDSGVIVTIDHEENALASYKES